MAHDPHPLELFRQAAQQCLRDLQAHEAGCRLGIDPEHVHQARVAIRRLRTALKLFAPVLPADFLTRWSPLWRELAQSLGRVRNWDVVLTQTLPPLAQAFAPSPEPTAALRHARAQRRLAHRALQRTLTSPAYAQLLGGFSAELLTLEPTTALRLRAFATQRLARRHARVRRLCQSTPSDPQALHALRLAVKTLRYALELLPPSRSSRRTRHQLEALARLQEHLGQLNDMATATALLPGPPGMVHAWMAGRTHLLIQTLPPLLTQVLTQEAPRA